MESVEALFLELEASCELDLPFTEQRAVRAGNIPEWRVASIIEQQALSQSTRARWCSRVRSEIVEGAGHICDLRAVEQIECFTKNLDSCTFRDVETTREAKIDIPNLR